MSAEMETVTIARGRKPAVSSGGKSWSDDEEVYLLQARLRKVAYKIIAAHLEKTELACRLHYHQLSHGGNRRKRTSSMSSSDSSPSNHSAIGIVRRSATPPRSSPIDQMKVLQRPLSGFQALNSPPPSDDASTQISESLKSSTTSKHKRVKRTIDAVDRQKLDQLVKSHTEKLWTAVAAEYGENFSPELLEKAWKKKVVKKSTPTTNSFSTTLTNTITSMPPPSPPPAQTAQDVITDKTNNGSTPYEFVEKEISQLDKALQQQQPEAKRISETTSAATTAETPSADPHQPHPPPKINTTTMKVANIIETSPSTPLPPPTPTLMDYSPRCGVDSPLEPTTTALTEKCHISMPSPMRDTPMINAK